MVRESFGTHYDVRQLIGPMNWVAINIAGGDQQLNPPIRCIYIGTAGNIVAEAINGGTVVTFVSPVVGQWIAFPARRILQSGTTAANMIGGYD